MKAQALQEPVQGTLNFSKRSLKFQIILCNLRATSGRRTESMKQEVSTASGREVQVTEKRGRRTSSPPGGFLRKPGGTPSFREQGGIVSTKTRPHHASRDCPRSTGAPAQESRSPAAPLSVSQE